jgi:hypothetical protein
MFYGRGRKHVQYLDYEKIVEESLLEAAKKILNEVSEKGLLDPHHLYLTFLTQYPGVILPVYLKDEYPEDITIVLQYQFWDLKIEKDFFSVVLSFNDQDELVKVPFKALINITDPSVNFSLDFDPVLLTEPSPDASSLSSPAEKKESSKKTIDNVISIDRFRKK